MNRTRITCFLKIGYIIQYSKTNTIHFLLISFEKRKNTLEAQFIVSDWRDKVDYLLGCRTSLSGYIGWRSGTVQKPHATVDFIPQ
jgi:hypothetical protein